jgi:hypothetical protein
MGLTNNYFLKLNEAKFCKNILLLTCSEAGEGTIGVQAQGEPILFQSQAHQGSACLPYHLLLVWVHL